MLIDVLTDLHAVAGVLAFAAGILSLSASRRSLFWVYLVTLTACIALMYVAIAVDWFALSNVAQHVYLALSILGGYMVFRAGHAWTELSERYDDDWYERYVSDLGFTLVSLLTAFVIVAVMDLHTPGWTVGVAALLAMGAGVEALRLYRQRHGSPAHG